MLNVQDIVFNTLSPLITNASDKINGCYMIQPPDPAIMPFVVIHSLDDKYSPVIGRLFHDITCKIDSYDNISSAGLDHAEDINSIGNNIFIALSNHYESNQQYNLQIICRESRSSSNGSLLTNVIICRIIIEEK